MLKDKLMNKLKKNGAKDLDPLEKSAKMGVVKELSRQAGSMMGDKVHPGMGKVSVASNTKEGLHHGLQDADKFLAHAGGPNSLAQHTGTSIPGKHGEEGSHEEEASEPHSEALAEGDVSPAEGSHESPIGQSEEELAAKHADTSPEELDAHIQKLTALKHKKMAGQA
jgi:hypothetical protein